MNILIDQNAVAIFFGNFELTDTGVQFLSGGVNNDYSTLNSSVIETDAPNPAISNVWKWENFAWVCINQEAVDAYFADQHVKHIETCIVFENFGLQHECVAFVLLNNV